ncbi:MAG: hypothetical protein ACLSBH_22520 [Coprobacillus cateniformis]
MEESDRDLMVKRSGNWTKIKLIMLSLEDFKILMVGVAIGGAILLIHLFMTQIGQKIIMQLNFLNTIQSTYLQVLFRGNIYDRNYNKTCL